MSPSSVCSSKIQPRYLILSLLNPHYWTIWPDNGQDEATIEQGYHDLPSGECQASSLLLSVSLQPELSFAEFLHTILCLVGVLRCGHWGGAIVEELLSAIRTLYLFCPVLISGHGYRWSTGHVLFPTRLTQNLIWCTVLVLYVSAFMNQRGKGEGRSMWHTTVFLSKSYL